MFLSWYFEDMWYSATFTLEGLLLIFTHPQITMFNLSSWETLYESPWQRSASYRCRHVGILMCVTWSCFSFPLPIILSFQIEFGYADNLKTFYFYSRRILMLNTFKGSIYGVCNPNLSGRLLNYTVRTRLTNFFQCIHKRRLILLFSHPLTMVMW